MRTALLISNMNWSGMGQTNRQAWAHALSDSGDYDRVIYVSNLGWHPKPVRHPIQVPGSRIFVVPAWNVLPWAGRPELRAFRVVNALLTIVLLTAVFRQWAACELLITFDPLSAFLTSAVRAKRKIYDCLDLYSEQPQYAQRARSQEILVESEIKLCAVVSQIAVSAPGLRERFDELAVGPVTYVPGAPTPPTQFSPGEDFRPQERDVAVYVGALDPYKVDYNLFRKVVELGYRVRLIGRLEQSTPNAVNDLKALLADRRISLRPPVPRPELIEALSSASLGLVAMSVSRYSDHSFPLKFWDYLWAGIPVLAVHCRSLSGMSTGVVSIDDLQSLNESTLCDVLARGADRERLRRFAADHSAIVRVKRILDGGVR